MNQTTEIPTPGAPSHTDTYPENVPPYPTAPPRTAPQQATSSAPERSWWSRLWHNLGRDSILVLPSMFISLIAFPVLIALFSVSIATLIIWIGALLLPLTLYVATGFANLSRARARQWGAPIAEVVRRPRSGGLRGWIGAMADGRRWLDLLFEAVFALPIRLLAFSVVVPWFFGALGGMTYFFWGRYLPNGNTDLITFIAAWWNDSSLVDLGFGAEATFQFVAGLILLLTFPFVLHAVARLEIAAITAGLAPGHDEAASAGKARAGDEMGHVPDGTASASLSVFGASASPAASASSTASAGSTISASSTASRGSASGSNTGSASESNMKPFMARAAGEGWFWLVSIFVGVVLLAVGWPVTTVLYDSPSIIAMLVVLGQSGALVLAVRKPVPAIFLGLASAVAGIILTADSLGLVWPWTVTSILALIFLHLIIGLRHSWLHLVILWSLSTVLGGLSLTMPHVGGLSGVLANVITTVSLTAGISAIAVIGNLWIRGRTQLATERQLSAEELAKRQELEERNRIAQELHDVVAHSMSVISVQATTAKYRLPELEDRSVDEFDAIAGSARQALNEMRGLLAILRGGRDADLAPQPTLDDIPDLVEATRGSGAEVELEFPSEPLALNATTGLTAFRLVQEALSNALRHAPGASVKVSVHADGPQLRVAAVNGAPGRDQVDRHQSDTHQPGQPGRDRDNPAVGHLGGGFGLKGMRERVEALGGTLRVGPTADGGFEVRATLPST